MDLTETNDDASAHVRLIVKTPDQQIDDQMVNCQLDWTVARLKDHLARVYPGKPKRAEQKVIFSGQLLDDSMILKDVLQQHYNSSDGPFIVHLVCAGQSRFSSTTRTLNVSGSASSAEAVIGGSVNVQSATAGVATGPGATPQPSPVQQYYSQLNNQQMAWMQQAYAHYLTQYMQLMAAQGIQYQSTSPYVQNENTSDSTSSDVHEDTEARGQGDPLLEAGPGGAPAATTDAAAPPGDAVNIGNNNNNNNNNINNNNNVNNNNNNNGAVDDVLGAGLNRDWLDVLDMLSRIVVLLSIVYFYSSPSRFLIVTFLGFTIYLIQGGFLRGQPAFLAENNNRVEQRNQVEAAAVARAQPPARPAPEPAEQTPMIPAATPAEHVEATAATTNLNEENERPGAWAFTWTFFSSFFASLIPDQPNVI